MSTSCFLYPFCKMQGKMHSNCISCEHHHFCAKSLGLHSRLTKTSNIVVNEFMDGECEVIIYPKDFEVLIEECNAPEIERGRKFEEVERVFFDKEKEGELMKVLSPKKEWVTLYDFEKNINRSMNRSLDNFFGYGLCNDWEYFITLTFDIKKVDRNNDELVKETWSKWLDSVRLKNPNIKCLLTPERHGKGQLHFHGFISNANICLAQAYYPYNYKFKNLRGKPILSKLGDPIFNIVDWDYGYSTCAVLPKDANKRKVINYCVKYIKVGSDIGYNKKRYYRTNNLDFKKKYSVNLKEEDIGMSLTDFYENLGLERVDKKGDIIVYRGKLKNDN